MLDTLPVREKARAPGDGALTSGHLLVQRLLEDVLVNVLDVDEVGVVGVEELFQTPDLLHEDPKISSGSTNLG